MRAVIESAHSATRRISTGIAEPELDWSCRAWSIGVGEPIFRSPSPVQLQSLRLGDTDLEVAFPDHPVLACSFAERFGGWVRDLAAPGSRAHLALEGGPHRAGFVCRKRNHQIGGNFSAHASGLAVKIAIFELANGEVLSIAEAKDERKMAVLATLRTAACGWFTTIRGPVLMRRTPLTGTSTSSDTAPATATGSASRSMTAIKGGRKASQCKFRGPTYVFSAATSPGSTLSPSCGRCAKHLDVVDIASCILRLRSALDTMSLHYDGCRVLVVAHQVVVLCMRYLLEHMTEEQILKIDLEGDVANCAVTEYRFDARPRPARRPRASPLQLRRSARASWGAGDGKA